MGPPGGKRGAARRFRRAKLTDSGDRRVNPGPGAEGRDIRSGGERGLLALGLLFPPGEAR